MTRVPDPGRLEALPKVMKLRARWSMSLKLALMLLRGLVWSLTMRQMARPLLMGRGVRLRNAGSIRASGRLILEDYAEVQGLSVRGVTFGARVSVGSFAMIRPSGYYSRPLGQGMAVGADSSIGPYCYIGCSGFIHIGERVMIGPGVRMFAEDHIFADPDEPIKNQGVVLKPIVVEDDCWIASGATLTGGVTVGAGSVVAAGSVVTKDVPPNTLVAGVPARVVKRMHEEVS